MRQKRWMEFLKDYDFELQYHLGKANVLLEKFRDMILSVTLSHDKMQLNSIQITKNLQKQIHEA